MPNTSDLNLELRLQTALKDRGLGSLRSIVLRLWKRGRSAEKIAPALVELTGEAVSSRTVRNYIDRWNEEAMEAGKPPPFPKRKYPARIRKEAERVDTG